VIAPFILIFNVVTFALFWFVYRYNTLYVTKFRFDTGGLLFPKAINQLFTGIYVMEFALVGLFFLVQDQNGKAACKGQAIVMIVVFFLTAGYQFFLNEAFSPLFQYLPITLEDDAVLRDQEFARLQANRLKGFPSEEEDANEQSLESRLKEQEERDLETPPEGSVDLNNVDANIHKGYNPDFLSKNFKAVGNVGKKIVGGRTWAETPILGRANNVFSGANPNTLASAALHRTRMKLGLDLERQGTVHADKIGTALFDGITDELEDLTPDERDQLVQHAFRHEALRAKRPVVWIPRDDIGVSDDEINLTRQYSKHIWISNEYVSLDSKGGCIFGRCPPDFSDVDIIQL
jgi:calcium permeable stress-gated cation channel